MKLGAALREAREMLAATSDSARLDAELLLAQVLGCQRAQLLLRDDEELPVIVSDAYRELLQRRADGEPVAYLIGRQGFWTLDLEVDHDVLVPRPETELLVELALSLMARETTAELVDLGTGSGAIALALKQERPGAQVDASDASSAALAVAQRNAWRLDLHVDFHGGSWWDALPAHRRYALAVSNPPYVAADDPHLAALRHEPLQALSDGADGLQDLATIIAGAPPRLLPGGWLLVEHGYDQGEAVRALFGAAGFTRIETRRDLEARERCTGGCLHD